MNDTTDNAPFIPSGTTVIVAEFPSLEFFLYIANAVWNEKKMICKNMNLALLWPPWYHVVCTNSV